MRITSATFVVSSFAPEQDPKDPGPDVLFLGRSNVGKSSLMNALLGKKGLARTSSTPGRTQSVNFFRINERYWFVDLPGYGYAKAPVAVRKAWGPMVEGALHRRAERVASAILLVDARRKPSDLDITMRDWLEASEIPWIAVTTKSDKLSGNGRTSARRVIDQSLDGAHRICPTILTSVQTGMGLKELWKRLDEALDG